MSFKAFASLAGPTIIRGGASLLGGSQPTDFEESAFSMAEMFKNKAETPLTQTNEYKSGRRELNAIDDKNRERTENLLGGGNVTQEAKLATMQGANEAMGAGVNALMSNVSRMRDFNQSRYLSTLGIAEQAKQNRIAQFNSNLSSILDPLSQAGQAYAMADMLGTKKK